MRSGASSGLLPLFVFLAACAASAPSSSPGGDAGADASAEDRSEIGWVVALDVTDTPTRAIDVLFVVDDSQSNDSAQTSLLMGQGDELIRTLTEELGAPPDLHVGVITTDLGVGGASAGGCSGAGRDGILQDTPRIPGCSPPSDRYIVDDVDPVTGVHTTNYQGSFAEALACIGDLPRDGCGFEQPLEAMRRALDGSRPENAGFRRPGALLAVIINTDEDDCSASDPALYAPSAGPDDPLGAQTSFRCFEQGVVCDPDDPRTLGRHHDCESREDSSYLHPVSGYADFLRGLAGAGDVYVHVVSGLAPFADVVIDDDGALALQGTCDYQDVDPGFPDVLPGWRLHHLVRALPGRAENTTMCQLYSTLELYGWPMAAIAPRIGRIAAGSRCLMGQLWDSDPAPRVQPVCRAFDVTSGPGGESRTPIGACGTGAWPCFRLVDSGACETDRDYAIEVDVRRDAAAPAGSRLVVECLHDDWAVSG